MSKVTITESNYKQVFGRLKKFFNHDGLLTWHQFDCGMKKRIGHILHQKEVTIDGEVFIPAETVNVMYHVSDVECVEMGSNLIVYYNDSDISCRLFGEDDKSCAADFSIGDEVAFLGNRIIVKSRWGLPNHHYCYQCYQIGGQFDTRKY